MTTPADLTMSTTQIARYYGISITQAQKRRRLACIAAGLPTPGEQRQAARERRGPVGTAKGYQRVRGASR